MNFQFTGTNGNPICLGWTEHPDSNVTQYQVWRYKAGESASAIGTLNRGTTSFTDYMYIQNPNGDAKLFYTVKAYYSPSGTWNDPDIFKIAVISILNWLQIPVVIKAKLHYC